MTTYLLAWNPKKWKWDDLKAAVDKVAGRQKAVDRWSCGNHKNIPKESPFFLIKLGQRPTGIIGYGVITSEPEPGEHWDGSGRLTNYVDIRFSDLREEPLITWRELQEPPFRRFRWGIQGSGIRVPEELASQLGILWNRRTGLRVPRIAEELPAGQKFVEGAKKVVTVNAYERDPLARDRCLEHYGYRCAVCDVLLEERYGKIAHELVHVHHIVKISSVKASYEVDPIMDLRPVCPNCHAILHREDPPMPIDKARKLVRR